MTNATATRRAATASDVMTGNPVSIRENLSLPEATAFLTKRGISAALVVNDAGRAIGVLSLTDVGRVSSDGVESPHGLGDFINQAMASSEVTQAEETKVRTAMTPQVLSVSLNSQLKEVCDTMIDQRVHRLFVVDRSGDVVGIISPMDILRYLAQ